jgi:hypothetical protein
VPVTYFGKLRYLTLLLLPIYRLPVHYIPVPGILKAVYAKRWMRYMALAFVCLHIWSQNIKFFWLFCVFCTIHFAVIKFGSLSLKFNGMLVLWFPDCLKIIFCHKKYLPYVLIFAQFRAGEGGGWAIVALKQYLLKPRTGLTLILTRFTIWLC